MPELPELNPVVHGKLRLALLSLLSGVEEAEFTWLRSRTGSTDGNLGAQLLKLEEAGYVTVEKKFVQRKPQTLYRMTEAGRQALTEYVQALKQLLGGAIGSLLTREHARIAANSARYPVQNMGAPGLASGTWESTDLNNRNYVVRALGPNRSTFRMKARPHPLHDAQVISQIMNRIQRSRQRLARLHQVAQIGA